MLVIDFEEELYISSLRFTAKGISRSEVVSFSAQRFLNNFAFYFFKLIDCVACEDLVVGFFFVLDLQGTVLELFIQNSDFFFFP